MTRIYRYEVPVDDQVHSIEITGYPLFVHCRQRDVVEFYAIEDSDVTPKPRHFLVVGTGFTLPGKTYRYWGTAVEPDGILVWHLIELEG